MSAGCPRPELQTLVKWADSGAAEGDPKDKPARSALRKVGRLANRTS
jgi:hypothetical protein